MGKVARNSFNVFFKNNLSGILIYLLMIRAHINTLHTHTVNDPGESKYIRVKLLIEAIIKICHPDKRLVIFSQNNVISPYFVLRLYLGLLRLICRHIFIAGKAFKGQLQTHQHKYKHKTCYFRYFFHSATSSSYIREQAQPS